MIKAVFIGQSEYIQGLPARSLTLEEWEALSDNKQRQVRDSGLYRIMSVKPEPVEEVEEEIDESEE